MARHYVQQAINKAKEESFNLHTQRVITRQRHVDSLDHLLASNGLQRNIVEDDGNCFFKAVTDSTDTSKTSGELLGVFVIMLLTILTL